MQTIDPIQVIAVLSVLLLIQTSRASYWAGRMKDNKRLISDLTEDVNDARIRANRLEKTLLKNSEHFPAPDADNT